MRHLGIVLLAALAIVLNTIPAAPAEAPETERDDALRDLLCDWNETVFVAAIAEDRLLTLKGLRTACLLHLAVHDALNATKPQFETFAYAERNAEADALAAAAQAAFSIISTQYPNLVPQLRQKLNTVLAAIPDGSSKTAGIALGNSCAKAILDERAGDGWDTKAEYTWHPMGPGVYAEFNEHSGTPEGFIFGAGWAQSKPFVLSSPDQFRSPPPPDISSPEYVNAFNEVKSVGRFQSMTRTADQTHLALWWKDFVENSHNRLARELVEKENMDAWSTARLFALLNMSIYDAYVNVFDNKFYYNHWRPYTAIRWAANDGNAHTTPDTLWNNTHRHTYAFPSYPSAHGTASAAAMTVLANMFGDEFAFTMSTPQVDIAGPLSEKFIMEPPTRSFESFSQAAMEASMSRVYLGIHFRYDSTEGVRLGSRIGRFVVENTLKHGVHSNTEQ